MKSEKAVTLITLVITIIVLIILTFTITVNVDQYANQKKRSNFETDIKNLKEEIDQYYAREKKLPIINKFTNVSMLESIKNVNDNENYYVIDIDKLNVRLNYGTDYSSIYQKEETEEITDLLDVYIINEESHTIYYPKGLEYSGELHYTLNATYNMIKVEGYVNKPKLLEGMTPIKFTMPTDETMGTTIETTEEDEDWYKYGTTYETKRWANAKTEDGSMWVWIPRYAYKITYYTDDTKTVVSESKTSYGSVDVVFLIGNTDNYYDENGAIKIAKRQTKEDETIDTTTGYTVHPAFTDESSINYANGGWDEELTGIWVAKFEAGYASGNNSATVKASSVNYTETVTVVSDIEVGKSSSSGYQKVDSRNWLDGIYGESLTSIKYPTFQGKTYSMNYINHNDAYNISRALTNAGNIYGLNSLDADSHLMKNSEWGAVAYLSHSKYGQNGTEITVNNVTLNSGNTKRTETSGKSGVDSVYAITGCTSNETTRISVATTIDKINAVTGNTPTTDTYGIYVWNQKTGQNASTTGTIYGIYDLSGGSIEETAGFISNGNIYLLTYAKALVDEAKVTYTDTVTSNTGKSTKYVTIYPNNEEGQTNITIASQKNFESNTNIYGDAIRETTSSNAGTNNTNWNISSWNSDASMFPGINSTLFSRGGYYNNHYTAGLFCFYRMNISSFYEGFRVVLVNK